MRCSHNELIMLLYKSAVASGCVIAVADEIARAACALQARGFAGVQSCLAAVAAVPTAAGKVSVTESVTGFERVAVAVHGPSVFDGLLANPDTRQNGVILQAVDYPLLLAGLALDRCGDHACGFSLSLSAGSDGVVAEHGYTISSACITPRGSGIPDGSCVSLGVTSANASRPAHSMADHVPEQMFEHASRRVEVSAALWQRASVLAARTLVPASEHSRRSGAGADS